MNELEQLKEMIEKELAGLAAYDDWDGGFDAGLRFAKDMIKAIQEKNRVRG